jgi:hypothetical protein
MQVLFNPQFWLYFVALIAAIFFLKRMTFREAYIKGASHGFALGISEVADLLIKNRMVKLNSNDFVTREELIDILAPLVTDGLVEKLQKTH